MKSEKNQILFFMLSFFKEAVKAERGCCSWHGGISHILTNGIIICNDGTESCTVLTKRKKDYSSS